MGNQTLLTEFVLVGLTEDPWLQLVLFVFFLPFYVINFIGNLAIMVLVTITPALHTPMYFLLANLSFLDIFFSAVTVPKLLAGLFGQNKISLKLCIVQMYFFHNLGSTEGVLLSTMAYDRYAAICHPLRYIVIMKKKVCYQMVFFSWLIGITFSVVISVMSSLLPYCKHNKIRHFFCDVKPVLKLACADTHINELAMAISSGAISICTFSLTIISYCYIITHLLKIKSSEGRRKAFSTCSSHLTIVTMFYGTAMCTYLGPSSEASIEKDRVAAILFTVITPAMNPVIYTLKNDQVKKSLHKLFNTGHLKKNANALIA
ncbi:olfactory receptor 12D1-like [Discoglossus pictus]